MASRRILIAVVPALLAGAGVAQDGQDPYGPEDAFEDAGRAAARANALPPPSALGDVPGYDPQTELQSLGADPARAAAAGAERRGNCEREPANPACAASATFSEAEPWLRRYPLSRDDAVFGGAARGEHPVGLGLDGMPAGTCVIITLAVEQDAYEELSCVSGEYPAPPGDLVAVAPASGGGPLRASSGRGDGGVHSIDISSGGRIAHLLYGVHDMSLTLSLSDPSAVADARLMRVRYNDWALVAVNGTAVFVGPGGGDRLEIRGLQVCTGAHACSSTWDFGREAQWIDLGIDIRPLLRAGANTVSVRLVHGGSGQFDLAGRIVEAATAQDRVRVRDFLDGHPEALPCSEIEGRNCFQYEVGECLVPSVAGGCAQWQYRYKCPAGEARTETVCSGERMYCADGACFDKESEPTSPEEFARAAAMLELARQAGTYLDPDTLRIFTGVPAHCRKRAFGLTDCCDADSGGGGMSNADMLSMLAAQAAGEAILFAGSQHVYDALYASEHLSALQGLLPAGSLGYTPGLSFFGIEATYSTVNGLAVTFDPASFAIAVGLAVVQSLLACEQSEQVLALRNGRGLCAPAGSYCARDTILGCATEKSAFCCYNSRLARMVAAGGRAQTGRGWGTPPFPDCEGFTAEEIGSIDFSAIDLSEAFGDFAPRHSQELIDRFKERAAAVVAEAPEGEQ